MPDPAFCRRRLLFALPAVALGLAGGPAGAATARDRRLVIHHRHTGEWLRTTYFAEGRYQPESLGRINRVLRDWRTDQMVAIDPRLLDIVHLLQRQLGLVAPLEVVCGYRSPATNAMLRRRSPEVARNSLHMLGQAIDVGFEGRTLRAVHRAAVALGAGGVGYYPGDGFIHLDSGSPRQWQQGAGSRRARAARRRALRRPPESLPEPA